MLVLAADLQALQGIAARLEVALKSWGLWKAARRLRRMTKTLSPLALHMWQLGSRFAPLHLAEAVSSTCLAQKAGWLLGQRAHSGALKQ